MEILYKIEPKRWKIRLIKILFDNRAQSVTKSSLDLKWIEDQKKQKYDKILTEKIGSTLNPFFRELERKRNFKGFSKIGQPELFHTLKLKKQLFYKIGHNY